MTLAQPIRSLEPLNRQRFDVSPGHISHVKSVIPFSGTRTVFGVEGPDGSRPSAEIHMSAVIMTSPGEIKDLKIADVRLIETVVYWDLAHCNGLDVYADTGDVFPFVRIQDFSQGKNYSVEEDDGNGGIRLNTDADHAVEQMQVRLPVHCWIGFGEPAFRKANCGGRFLEYVTWLQQLLEPEMVFALEDRFASWGLHFEYERPNIPQIMAPIRSTQSHLAGKPAKGYEADRIRRNCEKAEAYLRRMGERFTLARAGKPFEREAEYQARVASNAAREAETVRRRPGRPGKTAAI